MLTTTLPATAAPAAVAAAAAPFPIVEPMILVCECCGRKHRATPGQLWARVPTGGWPKFLCPRHALTLKGGEAA